MYSGRSIIRPRLSRPSIIQALEYPGPRLSGLSIIQITKVTIFMNFLPWIVYAIATFFCPDICPDNIWPLIGHLIDRQLFHLWYGTSITDHSLVAQKVKEKGPIGFRKHTVGNNSSTLPLPPPTQKKNIMLWMSYKWSSRPKATKWSVDLRT